MARTAIGNILRACMAPPIRRRCGVVALVVGTILNLINQGDALLGSAPIHWPRLLLTYLVPFFVCAYGALTAGAKKAPKT